MLPQAPEPQLHWFWAKLGVSTWPEVYHPVVCHLIDVGVVAQELWAKAIRDRVKTRVAEQLGLSVDDAGAWIAFWVAAHDIGKVTPCFQAQGNSEELTTRFRKAGYGPGGGENIHHTNTGTRVIYDFLRGNLPGLNVGDDIAQKVAVATGGHHGTFPTDWLDRSVNELEGDKWIAARTAILADLAARFGVVKLKPPCLANPQDQSVWMFLAGLTSVADWIGSNVTFFPSLVGESRKFDDPFDLNDYFTWAAKRAEDSLVALGWLGRAVPTDVVRNFVDATGIEKPRPLQVAIIAIAEKLTAPQLVIVEAPMGEGKTEAAWYVADCWDCRGGAGTYVALPTMATSNQMFGRVGKFLTDGVSKKNLMLQHGKAALNEQFEKLKYAARVYDDGSKTMSGVVAEEWFAKNKKHGLLAPYGVGTIDQVLLAVLQTKHVFVRLYGLAGKCIILDEVHAYDAYMTTLMERLLRWLAALGCPVVLLSATLPKEKRAKLLSAYAGTELPEPEHVDYPRITTVAVGEAKAEVIKIPAANPPRESTVHLNWVSNDALAETLKLTLVDGGCAAVIRNTVGLAQATYSMLKDTFAGTDTEVELFHARFPFGRRQEIETAVLGRYGKGEDDQPANPLRPKRAILVATQVIEQSLDLDFDVMFTDVAPVDLVLQRAGRLHRHARGARPAAVNRPGLWLVEPGEKDGRPDFGDSEWVYNRYVLLRSLIALKRKTTVRLPEDLETLVEQIYGNEPLPIGNEDEVDLDASHAVMVIEIRRQHLAAKSLMIYHPADEDLLEQLNVQLQEDDPEANQKIRAATRDTEPTVQLVLVYHCDGRDSLDPLGTEQFDESATLSPKWLRRLLDSEVTISNKGCVFHYVRQPVPEAWQKHGMLRHHRVVRLNPDGSSLAGEFELKYDHLLGVQF